MRCETVDRFEGRYVFLVQDFAVKRWGYAMYILRSTSTTHACSKLRETHVHEYSARTITTTMSTTCSATYVSKISYYFVTINRHVPFQYFIVHHCCFRRCFTSNYSKTNQISRLFHSCIRTGINPIAVLFLLRTSILGTPEKLFPLSPPHFPDLIVNTERSNATHKHFLTTDTQVKANSSSSTIHNNVQHCKQ